MVLEARFHRIVVDALARDRLVLPTLPEIALHVRQLAQRDDISAADLANEINKDPALAVRLLRVANSAAARGGHRVDNVRQAVTRLGFDYTRLLVSGLAVEQMFARGAPWLEARLRSAWQHSLEVAMSAQVLATHCSLLNPEMAMLGGLIHQIGVLPILRLAESHQDSLLFAEDLDAVLDQLAPRIGTLVLQAWHFPEELAEIPEQWPRLHDDHDGTPSYADVIRVAVLMSPVGQLPAWRDVDRREVPAFAKLDIDPSMPLPLDLQASPFSIGASAAA